MATLVNDALAVPVKMMYRRKRQLRDVEVDNAIITAKLVKALADGEQIMLKKKLHAERRANLDDVY